MFQDVRFGLKLLWKEKAFSLAVLITLALCIGANTAIFTILNAVILKPLPYPEPGRLVTMYNIYPGIGIFDRGANGVPDYLDRRQLTDVFESVALINLLGYEIGQEGSPQRIDGMRVTPSYFQMLRLKTALGRVFTEDETVLGKEHVAILTDELWRDMFGRDRNVLGKDIRLSGIPYRIIGVMPPGDDLYNRKTRVIVPFAFTPQQASDDARHSNGFQMIARLKPGISVVQAKQRIDALNRSILDRLPKLRPIIESARFETKIFDLKDHLTQSVRPTLYLLQAAVAFVLLIGCVNIANLLLVRSNIRLKELAIRFTFGAGKLRLGRQLFTESITLSVAGGFFAIGVGYAGIRLLWYLGVSELPRATGIQMDAAVFAFSFLLAVVTGIAFGSVPIFHLFKRDLNDVFRKNERGGTAERRAVWLRSSLVVCQVSIAFVLLIGSGLLAASFARVLAVDPGFKPERVHTARFSLPNVRYKDNALVREFEKTLLENLRAIPGVVQAGATTFLPFGGNNNNGVISIQGYTLAPGENPPVPGWNIADPGYFKALGIPLLQGRTFTEADSAESPRVVVIDDYLARKHWPKGGAIGAKILRGINNPDPPWTIVGIVGSVKTFDLADQNQLGHLYFPYTQSVQRSMHLVVKVTNDDPNIMAAVRREILRADPELALYDVKTMQERLSGSLLARRAAMTICLAFAGIALVLAAIGIYGVLAYTVTQRTREFGIRVALGAGARDILGMVTGHGLKLTSAGLALGIAGSFGLTRLMTSMLYEVKPTDPAIFFLVAFILGTVAVFASLVPSLRALQTQAASALRYE